MPGSIPHNPVSARTSREYRAVRGGIRLGVCDRRKLAPTPIDRPAPARFGALVKAARSARPRPAAEHGRPTPGVRPWRTISMDPPRPPAGPRLMIQETYEWYGLSIQPLAEARDL